MADPASFQSLDDGHRRVPWKSGASDYTAGRLTLLVHLRLSPPGKRNIHLPNDIMFRFYVMLIFGGVVLVVWFKVKSEE